MKFARPLLLATLVATVVALAPRADAGEPSAIPYTCSETDSEAPVVPEFTATLTVVGSSVPAAPKVFQPTRWTFDLAEPDLAPPLSVNLHYLRVRLPLPDGLANVSARLVAAPGETPNPAISAVALTQTAEEIVVQLPAVPGPSTRIRAASTDDGGGLTYPSNILGIGNPVVLPQIEVSATPVPSVGGGSIDWQAPVVESAVTISSEDRTVGCVPDGEPVPTVVDTAVSTDVQQCDGRAVTVQVGFNPATTGDDVIQGTAGPDTVSALGGNDRFCGLGGNDTFNGGAGNDRALGGGGNDTLRGDGGNDRLVGDAGNDVLVGGLGDDTALGGAGNDRPSGGAGKDNLQGDAGNDIVNGDAGNDTLGGGAGTDTVNGGAGDDRLNGGPQRDTCNGGPQRDTATACEVRISIP